MRRRIKKELAVLIPELLNFKQVASTAIKIFSIYWLVQLTISLAGVNNNYVLRFGLLMVLYSLFEKYLKDKMLWVMAVISIARLIIDKNVYSLNFLYEFVIIILLFRIFKSTVKGSFSTIAKIIFSTQIEASKLKQKMTLCDYIQKKENLSDKEFRDIAKKKNLEIVKHNNTYYIKSSLPLFPKDVLFNIDAEGLTQKQVDQIKNIGFEHITIYETMPFAPFMFFGALLTIIAKGNFLILLKNFL